MEQTKMLAPWEVQVNKIRAFFAKDKRVKVEYFPDLMEVEIYVKGSAKAEALEKLLPSEIEFGNVTLQIDVIPDDDDMDEWQLLMDALEGNEAVSRIETIQDGPAAGWTYVVFKPEVVQYYNDDIGDINGKHSTLMEQLVGSVLHIGSFPKSFFCTEKVGGGQ